MCFNLVHKYLMENTQQKYAIFKEWPVTSDKVSTINTAITIQKLRNIFATYYLPMIVVLTMVVFSLVVILRIF